ncbi:MAG: Flp family type IVb pilin [Pseudobdellovibrionaceae bacterium]
MNKKLFSKVKSAIKNFWKDESAQGATEYILLIFVVVALVVMFGPRLKTTLSGKMDTVGGQIESDFMNQ